MALKFKLEIELGNDAMQDQHDVAQALNDVEERLRKLVSGHFGPYGLALMDTLLEGKIMDRNGNAVGRWEVANGP